MERTQRTRRIRWVGIGMVIVALAVVAIWRDWPRERLLTEVARPIVQVKPQEEWSWLTDDKLLVITTEQEGDWPASQSWHGHVDQFNCGTHQRILLPGLTRLFNHPDISPLGPPNSMELSPGHTWLVWNNHRTFDGSPFPAAAHLDGTHYRDWGSDKDESGFFLDDQHYVQETGGRAFSVVVRDLKYAGKDRRYPRTAPEAKAVLAFQSARNPFYIERNVSLVAKGRIELDLYGEGAMSEYDTSLDSDRKPPLPLHKTLVRLPEEASLLDWHIAPVQDRVLYHLKVTRKNPVSILLHRLFPNFTTMPVVMEEIWISRIDGSQMHEIGNVPLPAVVTDPRQSDSDDPKHELEKVQWSPDGKQISFVYDDTLYVVPAVPGK